jgi:hypothetical protein
MNNVTRSADDTLQTLYYSKRFDTGILAGAVILSGFGRDRIAEHYETDFAETVTKLAADQFQVNDC